MDEDGVIFLGALYGRDRFGSILGMAWNKIAAKNQITNFERKRNTRSAFENLKWGSYKQFMTNDLDKKYILCSTKNLTEM